MSRLHDKAGMAGVMIVMGGELSTKYDRGTALGDAKADPSVQRLDTESLTPHEIALQISTRLKWGE